MNHLLVGSAKIKIQNLKIKPKHKIFFRKFQTLNETKSPMSDYTNTNNYYLFVCDELANEGKPLLRLFDCSGYPL